MELDNNVFINGAEISRMGDKYQLIIKLFDEKNHQTSFSTTLDSKYNIKKYEEEALRLLNRGNWLQVRFGVPLLQLNPILDDNQKTVVALNYEDKGILRKNEVKAYNFNQKIKHKEETFSQ